MVSAHFREGSQMGHASGLHQCVHVGILAPMHRGPHCNIPDEAGLKLWFLKLNVMKQENKDNKQVFLIHG